MSEFNIAAKSKDEQDKVAVHMVTFAAAFKERMNMPVVPEVVAREQPEHLREYYMEWVRHCRMLSIKLPNANDPRYIEMAEASRKPK